MLAILMLAVGANAAEFDGGEVETVTIADIDRGRVKIVGKLVQPVRQLVTIRGVWRKPDIAEKLSDLYFDVTQVEAERCDPPIVLREYDLRPVHDVGKPGSKDGEKWDWKAAWGAKDKPPKFGAGEVWEFVGTEVLETRIRVGEWEEEVSVAELGGGRFETYFKFFRARRVPAKSSAIQQGQRPPQEN